MSRRKDDPPGSYIRAKKPEGSKPLASKEVRRTAARPKSNRSTSRTRFISGIVGGILLVTGIAWLGWILTHQHQQSVLSTLPIPGLAPTNPPAVQIPPLLAAGITLGHPTQPPALNQQQAILIASKLEPDAAANAKSTSAQYVLLNYSSRSTPAIRSDLRNYPAWMVLYQNIPLQPSDASVDPTPFPQSHHDLYVFMDANTGKELLAIWV